MRNWRQYIQYWVARKDRIAHLTQQHVELMVWDIAPPTADLWPAHLPTCEALQDFYQLCAGGNFDWYRWNSLARMVEENAFWLQGDSLEGYDWATGNLMQPAQPLVLALDNGCPVVWDAATDQVRVLNTDGAVWEPPLASSVDAFLTDLFNPGVEKKSDWWYLFLHTLDDLIKKS